MQMNSLTLCHKVSHNRQTTFSCDVTILIFSLTGNKKGQNDNMLLRTTYVQTNKAWFDTTLLGKGNLRMWVFTVFPR